MANPIRWATPSTVVTAINGDTTSPSLKNLANNGQKLGSQYDNETNRYQFASAELLWTAAASPATNPGVELYLIPALDGTNYGDGDDSILPPSSSFVGVFGLKVATSLQRIVIRDIPIPPFKFKFLVINKTGQFSTNVDNQNGLRMRVYNLEV